MRRLPWWAWALVALVVLGILGALFWRWTRSDEPLPPSGPVVERPSSEIDRGRPTPAPPSVVTRIKTRPVPVGREVSRERPDTQLVRRFADAVRRVERWKRERDSLLRLVTTRADSDSVARARPEPRPVLPPVSGSYDGTRLRLWLSQSNGQTMRATARLRPHFTFLAGQGGMSDTLPIVREDRWWLRTTREIVGCSPEAAIVALGGALLDREKPLRGAIVGSSVSLLSCVIAD